MNLERKFLNENMMGPNSWLIAQELTKDLSLKKGMRVLDLGCGKGLTSIYLAKKFEVQVFALDLWISATENFGRFQQTGVSDLTIPLQCDALHLPFAQAFFDAVVSVDAYHYFGNNDTYFEKHLKPHLKKDAVVAIAVPGMKFEVAHHVPEEMKSLWDKDILEKVHSIDWWKPKFESHLRDFHISEINCFQQAWNDWLCCENPYALEDRKMMEADDGKYMNLIQLTGIIR